MRLADFKLTAADFGTLGQGLQRPECVWIDPDDICTFQPYWAVRAHLLRRLGKTPEAFDAFDRAIGLTEDPAVRQFLLHRRG